MLIFLILYIGFTSIIYLIAFISDRNSWIYRIRLYKFLFDFASLICLILIPISFLKDLTIYITLLVLLNITLTPIFNLIITILNIWSISKPSQKANFKQKRLQAIAKSFDVKPQKQADDDMINPDKKLKPLVF